jgi:hypothetical protein
MTLCQKFRIFQAVPLGVFKGKRFGTDFTGADPAAEGFHSRPKWPATVLNGQCKIWVTIHRPLDSERRSG